MARVVRSGGEKREFHASFISVILRCERQSREPRRMSGLNASAVALRGELVIGPARGPHRASAVGRPDFGPDPLAATSG
jgi:hypothetical protein